MKILFPILIVLVFVFSACTQQNVATPSSTEEAVTEVAETEDDYNFALKNENDIYLAGEKVGDVLPDGTVTLEYDGKMISFKAGSGDDTPEEIVGKIFNMNNDQTGKRSLMYDNHYGYLDIGKTFFGPYDTMKDFNPENISFECDGTAILDLADGKVKVAKCETNGTDYLTQYECSPGAVNPIVTGGEVTLSWEKNYVKKAGDEIYVFSGRLPVIKGMSSPWGVDLFGSSDEEIAEYCSEDTLDGVIAEVNDFDDTKGLIQEWDSLVESFDVAE